MNTIRRAVQVSSKTSRASQLQVSSSVLLVMRTLITSDINIDKKVRVPKGLKYQTKTITHINLTIIKINTEKYLQKKLQVQ